MREMKDSGFRWLNQIPCDWKVLKIKDGFKRKKAKAFQEEPVVLSLARSGVKIRDITTNEGQLAASYYEYNPVDIDDMLLNPMDLQSGANCSMSKVKGVISPAYVNLRYKKGFVPAFYDYYFKYQYWSYAFFTYGKGVSFDNRWTLNEDTLMNLPLLVPSLQEQQKIADYLDRKCGEIDSVMADLQEQIDKLEQYKRSVISETVTKGLNQKAPMKDSGISWVGMIPANWGVKRGKYIFSYIQKPTREDDGVITCFRDGEVTLRSNRREDGFTMSDKEIGYQGIDVGDLIIHGMDGFAGAIGISDSRGKASPVLNVLETNQSKRYFMYLLRTMAYKGIFEALSTGIRVRTCDTNWGKIKNIFYIVPPVEEQMCIVNYIDDKCAEIESIMADKKQQLEVIEKYKKSLIYEYVTGKKEVVDE
ncbi:MAG: restriction endonuclease subunit S [Clostridia bacterium]|nr:restriction endonuclease subunit S [Clostridia bacterium]